MQTLLELREGSSKEKRWTKERGNQKQKGGFLKQMRIEIQQGKTHLDRKKQHSGKSEL